MSLIFFYNKKIDSCLKIYQLTYLLVLTRIIAFDRISLPENFNLKGKTMEQKLHLPLENLLEK